MDFKNRQKVFDTVKWFDSIQAGEDRCGTYEFCGECRKKEKNPCARAARRYEKKYIRIATVYLHI